MHTETYIVPDINLLRGASWLALIFTFKYSCLPSVSYCKKIKITRGYLMRGTVDRGYNKSPLAWYRYWYN